MSEGEQRAERLKTAENVLVPSFNKTEQFAAGAKGNADRRARVIGAMAEDLNLRG